MSRKTDVQTLIKQKSRRLQKLREQEAVSGVNTDPGILIQIEDLERELAALQQQLADLPDEQEAEETGPAPVAPADRAIDTGGGVYIEGAVNTGGGDFTGRDKIENLIQHLEQKNVAGNYVEHQELTQIFLIGPEAQETVVKWFADRQGVDKRALRDAPRPPDHVERQIEAVAAAQQAAAAQGVALSPAAAYHLGLLAAYRRDYESALAYFQQATQANPEYSDAFESIAWLQQSRAMEDMGQGAYQAARRKLELARHAARQTDPLDGQALALRGFIAKSLAQLAAAGQNPAEQEKYYTEAARLFEHAAQLDPDNASVQNGLGNVHYALGKLDAAISAYRRAIELAPDYTAAYHDLALTCEAKMDADPKHKATWRREALAAWNQAYHLAPEDPTFSAEYVLQMGRRIRWLERQEAP